MNPTRPPGPVGTPLLGVLPQLRSRPLEFLLEVRREYGPVVSLPVGNHRLTFLAGPASIKHVLQECNDKYRKSARVIMLRALLGNGLLTSEGDHWRQQRRLVLPAFSADHLRSFWQLITDAVSDMLTRWQAAADSATPMNISDEMKTLTLRIIVKSMFGADAGTMADSAGAAVETALNHLHRRWLSSIRLPTWVPTPQNTALRNATATVDHTVRAIIKARRESTSRGDDLLSLLLDAQDDATGKRMSDDDLRDEVKTIFAAGHETTANALSWLWYLLSKNPQAARALHAETDRVIGDRVPTLDDLDQLTATRNAIDEALRIYPPAWAITRTAITGDEVCGYPVPAGSTVLLSPYVTHRDPELWSNPEGFDPDRFNKTEDRPRFAYFPFSAGPRKCIGAAFALLESRLIVAMVCQRFSLHLVPGHEVIPLPAITLTSAKGIYMSVHRRGRVDQEAQPLGALHGTPK